MNRIGFVTSSMCRALADRGLAALEAQGIRFASGLNPILGRQVSTKKELRHLVRELGRLGEAAHLVQVIGRTPNERDALTSQFVPYIVTPNPSGRKRLGFYLFQTVFSVRRIVRSGSDSGEVLEVEDHAVERLFQRLNTLTLESVADELRDAMLFALPLTEVVKQLGLRQIALPTSNGAFLCHFSSESRAVVAKTWLPADGMGSRWDHVRSVIREVSAQYGGEGELARLLGSGMKRSITEGDCRVVEALVRALSKIYWLKEQYLPRPDLVGDVWEAARRQALAAD